MPDPADRRAVSVGLTKHGVEATDAAITAHVELEHELLAPLSERERARLDRRVAKWFTPEP